MTTESRAPRRSSAYANEGDVKEQHASVPESAGGHEDQRGPSDAARVAASEAPVGAMPRGALTGGHDSGSGANQAADGLTSSEEALREAAEDGAEDADADADIPVFDRRDQPPGI